MSEQPAAMGLDGDRMPAGATPASAEGIRADGPADASPTGLADLPPATPRRASFAHESEAELARILDFYAVQWEYEPHTYPILWDLDGGVLESFSPDFYLQDLDMYLELTTLKQKLVRKKNRKLRRLRECYPDIRIKLFYARDFRMLMLKYGKLALVDALSGTLGQVVPPGRNPPAGDLDDATEGDGPPDPDRAGSPDHDVARGQHSDAATRRTNGSPSRTISMSAAAGAAKEPHPGGSDAVTPAMGEERASVRSRRRTAARRPVDSADRRSEAAAP